MKLDLTYIEVNRKVMEHADPQIKTTVFDHFRTHVRGQISDKIAQWIAGKMIGHSLFTNLLACRFSIAATILSHGDGT